MYKPTGRESHGAALDVLGKAFYSEPFAVCPCRALGHWWMASAGHASWGGAQGSPVPDVGVTGLYRGNWVLGKVLFGPRDCRIIPWHGQGNPANIPAANTPIRLGKGSETRSSQGQGGSSVGSRLGAGASDLAWPLGSPGDAERSQHPLPEVGRALSKPLETRSGRVLSPEEPFLL